MPSIIPGYEYDIFISYRQKDNTMDGWVTEFVSALRSEIESTFKEDISIYFDENPHDGLNEAHDVDASLKDKIRSLIFIPIVSHTYCDPNCFAWQKEFLPFMDFVKNDPIGFGIKVSQGNVIKRVLPVRIHQISKEDQDLMEKELEGILRPIDFIYKEPGVSRPLLPSDSKAENQEKTDYRNQVNKVVNAIKELIISIKKESNSDVFTQEAPITTIETDESSFVKKKGISKTLIGIVTIVILSLSAYLIFNREETPYTKSEDDNSLAVMYFDNLTGQESLSWLQAGMVEMLVTNLAVNKNLNLLSSQGLFNILREDSGEEDLKISMSTASRIAKKANVNRMLVGSYLGPNENDLRINTQLIDVSTGKVMETWVMETNSSFSIFNLADSLSDLIAQLNTSSAPVPTSEQVKMTYSLDAQKHYIEGLQSIYKGDFGNAVKSLEKAISYDSTFAMAYYQLNLAASYTGVGTSIRNSRSKALKYKSKLSTEYAKFMEVLNVQGRIERIDKLKEYLNQYPGNKEAWLALGEDQYHSYWIRQSQAAFRKSIEIDPYFVLGYFHIMDYYGYANQQDSFKLYIDKILSLQEENITAMANRAILDYSLSGNELKFLEEIKQIAKDTNSLFEMAMLNIAHEANRNYDTTESIYQSLYEGQSFKLLVLSAWTKSRLNRGELKSALELIEEIKNDYATEAKVIYSMGVFYFLMEDYPQLNDLINKMNSTKSLLSEQKALLYHLIGLSELGKGNLKAAKEQITQLRSIIKDSKSAYNQLITDLEARIHFFNKDYNAAEKSFRMTREYGPLIEYNYVSFFDLSTYGILESLSESKRFMEFDNEFKKTKYIHWVNSLSYPTSIIQHRMNLLNAQSHYLRGDSERAKKEYQNMIDELYRADLDFPFLIQAKKELKALN